MKKGQKVFFLDMLDWEGLEQVRPGRYQGQNRLLPQYHEVEFLVKYPGNRKSVLLENIFETKTEAEEKLKKILKAKRAAENGRTEQ